MSNIFDLEDYKYKKTKTYVVFSLCMNCFCRWIGHVKIDTSLFKLECPKCGVQDSFASFVPDSYLEDLEDREDNEQQ